MQLIKKMIILNGLSDSANAVLKIEKMNDAVTARVNFYTLFKDNMYIGIKTKSNAIKIYQISSNNSVINLDSDLNFDEVIECIIVDLDKMVPLYYGSTNAQRPIYANLLDGFNNYKAVEKPELKEKALDNQKAAEVIKNSEIKNNTKTSVNNDNETSKVSTETKSKDNTSEVIKKDKSNDIKDVSKEVKSSKTIKINATSIVTEKAVPVQNNIVQEEEQQSEENIINKDPNQQKMNNTSSNQQDKITSPNKTQIKKETELHNIVTEKSSSNKEDNEMSFDDRPITPLDMNSDEENNMKTEKKEDEKKEYSNIKQEKEININKENEKSNTQKDKVYCPNECNIAGKIGEEKTLNSSKNFYDSIENKLNELFKNNPSEEVLTSLIQGSKWAKVSVDKDNFYVIGILTEDNKPTYVCYGVEGSKNIAPTDCKDYQWIPAVPDESKGYWIIFQDALTGKVIKES